MRADFSPFEAKMRAAGLPSLAIETFRGYYEQLCAGTTGLIPEASLEPLEPLPSSEALAPHGAAGARALGATVVIKLNGGLGTGMGMQRAKSLLPVKEGLCFLDVIARQVSALRERAGARLPLVLMNSFATRDDSLAHLARYESLSVDLPADFLQHRVPRIRVDDLSPVAWEPDPEAEWCPPGHGDLYPALVTSGALESMLSADYRYAFVSNSDNLGAVLDPSILGFLVERELPFLMEVADRTEADRKGGHLAREREGQGGLLLRESAQCPDEDQDSFQDIGRHRYFNTNSLWIDLRALAERLDACDGLLGLPMIRNEKPVVASDAETPRVYQLETAMGAAISVFPGAAALRVPRQRFAPVKATSDLLVVRSDAYALTEGAELVPQCPPEALPRVSLDARFKSVAEFDARFPAGPPSLRACRTLRVEGDVVFGEGVVVEGDAEVRAEPGQAHRVPDGARLGS